MDVLVCGGQGIVNCMHVHILHFLLRNAGFGYKSWIVYALLTVEGKIILKTDGTVLYGSTHTIYMSCFKIVHIFFWHKWVILFLFDFYTLLFLFFYCEMLVSAFWFMGFTWHT